MRRIYPPNSSYAKRSLASDRIKGKKTLLLRNDSKIRIYTLILLEERHLCTSTNGNGIGDAFKLERCVENSKRTPAR